MAGFHDLSQVRSALSRLHAAGVHRESISMLLAEPGRTPCFELRRGHKLSEGFSAGAALGGLLGAGVGALLAITQASSPSHSPPSLMITIAAFAGAGLGGVLGGIIGAIFGGRTPEYRARLVDAPAHGSTALISVWPTDPREGDRVSAILTSHCH